MNKTILSKYPANIIAVLIMLFCCLNTGTTRAQCTAPTYTVCAGSTTTITTSCTPATAWGSSATSIAAISSSDTLSAVVAGVAAGGTTITYTGAGIPRTVGITVIPLPNAGTITGASAVCVAATITLSDVVTGGTWSSSATGIATVSTTGAVYGVAAGTATITYTYTNACGTAYTTKAIVVDAAAPTASFFTGASPTAICEPGSATFFAYAPPAGVIASWSHTGVAATDTYGTSGIYNTDRITPTAICSSTGSLTLTYTCTNSCGSNSDHKTVTIHPANIMNSGKSYMCPGSSFLFQNCAPGGIWSTSDTSVASVNTSGMVTARAIGTATISYVKTGICPSTSTYGVRVDTPTSVTVADSICSGSGNTTTAVLHLYPYYGGTWSSSSTSIATVSTTGVVTGVGSGTAIISYSGCGSVPVTDAIIIHTAPTVTPILPTGVGSNVNMCTGTTFTLSDATSGGTWSSSSPSIASIDTSGVVYGISAGFPTITYRVIAAGCTTRVTKLVNIYTTPYAGTITGPSTVCIGANITLSNPTATPPVAYSMAGEWYCNPTSIATINPSTHVVYGISGGTAIVTYVARRLTDTMCGSDTAFYSVVVNPPLPPITGGTTFCQSSGTILYNAVTGGRWASADPTIATIDTATGVLTVTTTATTVTTTTIYYTVLTACGYAYTSTVVTINPNPTITGPFSVCQGAVSLPLGATVPFGTWSSSMPSIASVHPVTHVVYGVSVGSVTIAYSIPATGCGTTATFTVNPLPVITITSGISAPLWLPLVFCNNTLSLTASGALSYSWSPATYLSTTVLPTTTISGLTTPTVYTVTGTNGFGCSSTATQSIVLPVCDQAYCPYFSGGPIYSLSGNIGTTGVTTTMPIGNYSVSGNVNFFGTINFANSVVAIAPTFGWNMDAQGELNIIGSHLFCCDKAGMWQGITLSSSSTSSARMYIGGNSCVEDATTGVKIYNGRIPAGGLKVFVSDGTVFNRNIISVDISQFPAIGSAAPPPPYIYPFTIRNTVFTSRELANLYVSSGYGWPMVWPAPSGTATALKKPYTPPSPLMPPFNVINPNGAGAIGSRYNYATCNGGLLANIGIKLANVGAYATLPFPPNSPATFSEIVIGDSAYSAGNTAQNLFDTLLEGIHATYSNFTCYDNAFIYMHKPPTAYPTMTGDGIGADATALATASTIMPEYRMQLLQGGNKPANVFYDNARGVTSLDYYYVTAKASEMYCYQHLALTGSYGYFLKSRRYYDINITGNTLTNMNNAIAMNTSMAGGAISQFAGGLNIKFNRIYSNYLGAAPTSASQFTTNGITVNNAYTGAASGILYSSLGTVHIDTNNMQYVYNGINVSGYNMQPVTSDSNVVRVNQRPTASWQYGITHSNCTNNFIRQNTVIGPGWNVPAPIAGSAYGHTGASTASPANPMIEAVYSTGNVNATISCNYGGHINTGYHIADVTSSTTWINNVMNDNAYGLLLDGIMGWQTPTSTASYNLWAGGTSAWTGMHFNTWTRNSGFAPTGSRLFVTTNSGSFVFTPTNNRGDFAAPTWYNAGVSIFILGAPTLPACEMRFVSPVIGWPLRMAATHDGDYAIMTKAQNWIAQKSIMQLMATDSSYADSSDTLAKFYDKAQNSRLGWLTQIENAIVAGDYSTATSLLTDDIHAHIDTAIDSATGVVLADGIEVDNIVQNYITLYNKYLKYKDTLMDGNDSLAVLAIANLCPNTDGNVVYQARALYRTIFEDDTTVFSDNCGFDTTAPDTSARGAYDRSSASTKAQAYQLFPNPNDGSFKLRQMIGDDAPVVITVKDVLGRSVFTQNAQFQNGSTQLQLSHLSSGVYLLQISDSNNKISNFKFVVQK